jgi:hypothetical protein
MGGARLRDRIGVLAAVQLEGARPWRGVDIAGLVVGSAIETGVPFVVNGPTTTLRDAHGHAIGQLQVSIQDVIAYVRLNERLDRVETVVRGRGSADVRTSLPAALKVKLPSSGTVTIAGHRYEVGSFHLTEWRGEPLQIWILK